STEVNEFDIQEFSVKRGAITAEFGRSSGFVTNAVTRSGSNTLHGGFRLEAIPNEWIRDSDKTIRSSTDRFVPSVALGGPVLRDRIFFYASAQLARSDTTGRVNNLGPVPDRKTRTSDYFGKLTAAPANDHFFAASYRARPNQDDYAGVGANDAASVATNNEGTNRVATANYSWFFSSRGYLDVKYLRLDEQNESVAVTDLGFRPTFDVNNLAAMGAFTDAGVTVGGNSLRLNRQNYTRDEVKAVVSQYLDFGGASHQLKFGFGAEATTEDLTRLSNGWGAVSIVQAGRQILARYYPLQPSQLSKSRTYSLFVQDNISIGTRIVINAGVLLNRDEFAQEIERTDTFLTFGMGDQIQPRIGINYQLRAGKGDKIYANYGRYYNSDQKSSARSLAPNRLYTHDALFDAFTGELISDEPGSNTTGKVLRDFDPTYTDEVLFGYATPLTTNWSLDAFFLYRTSTNFIEDQPTILPASSFVVDNLANAERKYRTFTVELSRRLADRWSLNASYAYSRLWGNFDLDYAAGAVFNTSSILQDGPGVFVEDRFRYGPLSQDRTHVFKLFGTWVPVERLTLGGYLRAQSGQPWEARGRDWYDGYRRYLEPAGSRRNDTWVNVDFLAAYRLPLGSRAGITFEGRILNLFNAETALERDNRLYLDGRIRTLDGTERPGDPASYTDAMIQGTTQPNPRFGEPTVYAAPQRLLGTIRIDF
ncbi:MAG TPA: TonB-dependent receptor, partial [Vicinamibacterales bacterium]